MICCQNGRKGDIMANAVLSGQTFYGRNGSTYTLDTFIKKGGEGQVYAIKGEPEKVVKLYTAKKFRPTKYISDPKTYLREKIETMLDNPVQTHLHGQLVITWPTDILFDSSHQFCGYVMPRVHVSKSLKSAIDTGLQSQLIKNYTWKTSVGIAYNLAQAVDLIHSKGYVIGDLNELNFLVDHKGHITVIDTDSFNITNRKTGKTYKCTVGRDELMPPELQGKDRSRPNTVFTKESDNFGLAIHIFELLMNGVHPFGSISSSGGRSTPSTSNGHESHNIMNGICPYVTGGSGKPSKLAPDVKMLPVEIRNLLDRTFKYTAAQAAAKSTALKRASASDWIAALSHLLNENYSKHGTHVYLSSYGKCPWCAIGQSSRRKPVKKIIPPVQIPAIPGLKLAGFKKIVPAAFKKPVPAALTVRRSEHVLTAACIGTGLLISPYLAQYMIPLIASMSGLALPLSAVMITLALFGAISGYVISFFAQDRYVSAYNGLPWLLVALLSPAAACVCMLIGTFMIKLLGILLQGVMALVEALFVILLLLVLFGAFI